MRVFSFYLNNHQLEEMEVELTLMPGLPQIQFSGLPDTATRESQWRIKSALRAYEYTWPKGQKVVVNLKPNHIRKTSPGLDLAIAAAYLAETKQIEFEESKDKLFFYGELGLDGAVKALPELETLSELKNRTLITGEHKSFLGVNTWVAPNLGELGELQFKEAHPAAYKIIRPRLNEISFSKRAADTLAIAAVGHHSLLLAGPSGTGKTTIAETLHKLLKTPTQKEFRKIQSLSRLFGDRLYWRPWVAPHHTSPTKSLLGGTGQALPGEITRAHGGLLFLDEFLEFKNEVKEALREPIEKSEMSVARLGKKQVYPADFLFVAATNLCPCGEFRPGRWSGCSFSLNRCQSYLQKLSGPMLDRFQMVSLSHLWGGEKTESLESIYESVQQAREFSVSQGRKSLNAKLTVSEVHKTMSDFTKKNLVPDTGASFRRELSLLRVARSIADLEKSPMIEAHHLQKATSFALKPMRELQEAMS